MNGLWKVNRQDSGILSDSNLIPFLSGNIVFDDEKFVIYWGKEYGSNPIIYSPFKGKNESQEKKELNQLKRKCRICVV